MSTNRSIDAFLLKVSSSYADSDLPNEFSQNGHSQVVCTQIRSVALSAGAPRNPISNYAAVSLLPLRWN